MTNLIRKLTFTPENSPTQFLYNEWLVTNGLGGYASTSLSGTTTRKYHGLLVAALPAPLGRMVMLNYIQDRVLLSDGNQIPLSFEEFAHKDPFPEIPLTGFRLDDGLPIWTYSFKGYILEKSIFMPYKQNTVHITYNFLEGPEKIELSFQPFYQFRHLEEAVTQSFKDNYLYTIIDNQYEIKAPPLPSLKILPSQDVKFIHENDTLKNIQYRIEAERGYDSVGDLKSSGSFIAKLEPKQAISFIASTEPWETINALSSQDCLKAEKERRQFLILESKKYLFDLENVPLVSELIFAADQFIITPVTRTQDIAWTHSIGEEARTIVAGYHWFTDWGRDTMISLEGLTLVTGRIQEAGYILRTFAHHLKDGLIPDLFPDGQNHGLYNTADATLWFFHALDRYYAYSKDDGMMEILMPKIQKILDFHFKGTDFGIHLDTQDGLLIQGQEGYALTWMDAKVGDLVITPREEKP